MARFVALLSTGSLICLLVAMILYLRFFAPGAKYTPLSASAVVKEVKPLKELVTVKYSIEKVVGMREQKSPVGEESILLLVQGKVLAGVDLGALVTGDVILRDSKHAVIRLAKPRIQEVFLDEKSTKLWDRSITWWTPWVSPDPDLEHKARMQAINDIRDDAMSMGILQDAQKNAENSIRALLQMVGLQEISFDYST